MTGSIDMPSDCFLLALEARERMLRVCSWVRLLILELPQRGENKEHVMCAFLAPDGNVWAYDSSGSLNLRTGPQSAKTLAAAISKLLKEPVKNARFLKERAPTA